MPSEPQMERRFIFRGNASGVAAHMRRPTDEVIPVQAASSLPVIGGVSESTAQGRQFQNLGFESAFTSATGDFVDSEAAIDITLHKRPPDSVPTRTTVISEVKGLTLLDSVRVGKVHAEMTGRSGDKNGETSITPHASAIEGLIILGEELIVKLDDDFFVKHDTKESIHEAMEDPDDDDGAARHCFEESDGIIYTTLVEDLRWADKPPEGVTIDRNAVIIPDFGTLYLAELLISHNSRRLTMVRAELGSPAGGHAAAGSIETNGSSWPA